jgi:N-acyl-D-amino-acid deacylase
MDMGLKIRFTDIVRAALLSGGVLYLLSAAGSGAPPPDAAVQPGKPQADAIAPKSTENARADAKRPDTAKREIKIPTSGSGIDSLDNIVFDVMQARSIPGVALAVCKQGDLLVLRGYGWSNLSTHEALLPDSLFCLAGVSDVITTTAILKLIDEGRLTLDDRIYGLLGKPQPLPSASVDSRYELITVRHLLLHSGGWNEKEHGDLMFMPGKIARAMHEKLPLSREMLVRYAVSQPLDFAPGAKSRHSNFGYFLARLVIEKAAGQSYETYVRQHVLKPLGISAMRLEPASPGYALHEVRRYDSQGLQLPGGHTAIGAPHGSWLGSAAEVSRLMSSLNAPEDHSIVKAVSLASMLAMPPTPLAVSKGGSHVGLGWDSVQTTDSGVAYHKSGAAGGIRTFVEHRPNGITWLLLMNSDGNGVQQGSASKELIEKLREAIDQTKDWPQRNLFPSSSLAGPGK